MPPARDKIDPQLVYLDPFLLERARVRTGVSRKELAGKAKLAVNTVLEAFAGRGVQTATAHLIAKHVGHDVLELLAPYDPRYVPPANAAGPWSAHGEWETAGYLEQGRLASNGLYYIVCRMRHRHTTHRAGRGKFYHLSWLPPATRGGMEAKLSRHAEVCARVGSHPQIAVNHSSTPVADGEGWWVVDEWVGERSLADALTGGPWPEEKLAALLLDVALGLDALHRAEIVFRELAPARVLISDADGRAVLTDFELAKLLDGSPSVASEWPEDPFRAPEVDGGGASIRADLYSFGRLAAAAAGGAVTSGPEAFQRTTLPKRLQSLLAKCVEPVPARRPDGMAPLLAELHRCIKRR